LNPGSARVFRKASRLMPGGVNSPVRSCKAGGASDFSNERAAGPTCGFGRQQVCTPTRLLVTDDLSVIAIPEFWRRWKMRLEVVTLWCAMQARGRTSRAYVPYRSLDRNACAWFTSPRLCLSSLHPRAWHALTKRSMFIKVDGCYHELMAPFLVKAGSGVATLASPARRALLKSAKRRVHAFTATGRRRKASPTHRKNCLRFVGAVVGTWVICRRKFPQKLGATMHQARCLLVSKR